MLILSLRAQMGLPFALMVPLSTFEPSHNPSGFYQLPSDTLLSSPSIRN